MKKKTMEVDLFEESTNKMNAKEPTMKKCSIHKRAKELIQQLDQLAKQYPTPWGQVALVSPLGSIFSWQKRKLKNLEFSLKRGQPSGFIVMHGENGGVVHIKLMPDIDLVEERGEVYGADEITTELILSIENVWHALDCGYEDPECCGKEYINEDFRKEIQDDELSA